MSEYKNLIKYHNNIFTRIICFFRRLIKNKKSELIDTKTNIPTNIHKNDNLSYLKIIMFLKRILNKFFSEGTDLSFS